VPVLLAWSLVHRGCCGCETNSTGKLKLAMDGGTFARSVLVLLLAGCLVLL